jgi:hypothetical protein
MLDFEEFREKWKTVDAPLLIVAKDKNLSRLEEQVGAAPRKLASIDEYVVLAKP